MKANNKQYAKYIGSLIAGMILAIIFSPLINFVGQPFVFVKEYLLGFEIHSKASHPYNHRARLYTNPGFGEQDLTLKVNRETVWQTNAIGGNLNDELIWDKTGHILTLKIMGEAVFVYDAQNRVVKYK